MNKIAIIQINEHKKFDDNSDCYWFPVDITETELIQEIQDLKKMYDVVQVQQPLPPHIRLEVAIAAIEKEV